MQHVTICHQGQVARTVQAALQVEPDYDFHSKPALTVTLNYSLIVLYLFIYYYISICVLDAPKVNKILSTLLLSILLTYLVLYSYDR